MYVFPFPDCDNIMDDYNQILGEQHIVHYGAIIYSLGNLSGG